MYDLLNVLLSEHYPLVAPESSSESHLFGNSGTQCRSPSSIGYVYCLRSYQKGIL